MKMRTGWRWAVGVAPLVAVAATTMWNTTPAQGQQQPVAVSAGTSKGEWPTYGGNLASMRYSPLDQINASNFSKLEVAWRFKTDALGPRQEFNLQGTPLMLNGIVYATGGTRR